MSSEYGMTQDALYGLRFDFRFVHHPARERVPQVVQAKALARLNLYARLDSSRPEVVAHKHCGGEQQSELTDVTAKVVIYEAFVEGKLEAPKHLARRVHDLYFEPRYEEFRSRTIWSLSNAFTSAFKELHPIPQFKVTAKLGEFLESRFSRFLLGAGGGTGRAANSFIPVFA